MPRPIWTGSLSFGLVNVPVRLFSAVAPKEVHFHMLHDKDGARIQQKRVCSAEGKEVPWEHIVKGFEIAKGRYVKVAPEELEKLLPEATRQIEIGDFVELAEIDPIYYDATYYLSPDRGAGKAYALLLQAMRRTGKVGIGHMVLRTKEYLCAIRPLGDVIALSTMQYADEIVPQDKLDDLPKKGDAPPGKQLEMAEQLVQQLAGAFDPAKYHDRYREQVIALLEKKAAGEEIVEPEAPEKPARIVDLMEALKQSLQTAPARGGSEKKDVPRAQRRAARRPARHGKRKSA
jgi:DNA end-binding protein Ku